MFTIDNQDAGREKSVSSPISRRGMLGVSFSAAIGSLAMASPLAAAPYFSSLDFGPQFVVRKVCHSGRHTQVDLGFRVNGRPFTTQLRSIDNRTWRPV